MTPPDYEAALRAATWHSTHTPRGAKDQHAGQLAMLGHRLFDATREAFCPESASGTDRIFGVDTENEQFYERARHRASLVTAKSTQAIALLTEACRILSDWSRASRTDRQMQARALIRAVDTVYETIERLGPIAPNPATDWQTRRPAFR